MYAILVLYASFLSVFCFPKGFISLVPIPSENFAFYDVLDTNKNFHLFWKFNETHITFELHVRQRGYVGFGMSPNGRMFPSDVVVGWVKDGKVHFAVSISYLVRCNIMTLRPPH